jgi:hypothetical protein
VDGLAGLFEDFRDELKHGPPRAEFGLGMQTRFWACLIVNAFAREAVTSFTVDVGIPVRSCCAHLVSKNSDLIERCEGIRIAGEDEDFGLNCVSLRRDWTA